MRGSTMLSLFAIAASTAALPAASPFDAAADLAKRSVLSDVIACASHWYEKDDQCSTDDVQMPAVADSTTQLPTPTGKLAYVLLGRGVQNYTCDPSSPSSTPAAVGAVASLYDATCEASVGDWCVGHAPNRALDKKLDQSNPPETFMRLNLIGHHYFTDAKSPVFNLKTAKSDHGYVAVSKTASVDAPKDAMKGVNDKGDGAVTWLYLSRNTKISNVVNQQTYSAVYRINTAGGNAPKTCEGQKEQISVDYAAEYWFYH